MRKKRDSLKGKELEEFNAWLDLVSEWLASRPTKDPPTDDKDMSLHARGYRAFFDDQKRDLSPMPRRLDCSSCHSYKKEAGGVAPDMTGYGEINAGKSRIGVLLFRRLIRWVRVRFLI